MCGPRLVVQLWCDPQWHGHRTEFLEIFFLFNVHLVQSTHVVQQNDVMVHGTNNSLILLCDKRGMNLGLILTKRIAFLLFPLAFSQSYFMEQRLDSGPDSSVGIATDYGLDGPGIESRWGEIFRRPDRPWGPPSLLYNGYRVFPGGRKRPGRDADPSLPSSAEV